MEVVNGCVSIVRQAIDNVGDKHTDRIDALAMGCALLLTLQDWNNPQNTPVHEHYQDVKIG